MGSSENFCLRWNDFESNISLAFRELREEKDFFDVTLACDDSQIQAHKVILSACSTFFRTVLRKNPHQHPLLYLKGVKYKELMSVLNFMYSGEVSVPQEELNSFLAVAEDLCVNGLTQNNSESGDKTKSMSSKSNSGKSREPPEREAGPPPKRARPVPSTPVHTNNSTLSTINDDDIHVVVSRKSEPSEATTPSTAMTTSNQNDYQDSHIVEPVENHDNSYNYFADGLNDSRDRMNPNTDLHIELEADENKGRIWAELLVPEQEVMARSKILAQDSQQTEKSQSFQTAGSLKRMKSFDEDMTSWEFSEIPWNDVVLLEFDVKAVGGGNLTKEITLCKGKTLPRTIFRNTFFEVFLNADLTFESTVGISVVPVKSQTGKMYPQSIKKDPLEPQPDMMHARVLNFEGDVVVLQNNELIPVTRSTESVDVQNIANIVKMENIENLESMEILTDNLQVDDVDGAEKKNNSGILHDGRVSQDDNGDGHDMVGCTLAQDDGDRLEDSRSNEEDSRGKDGQAVLNSTVLETDLYWKLVQEFPTLIVPLFNSRCQDAFNKDEWIEDMALYRRVMKEITEVVIDFVEKQLHGCNIPTKGFWTKVVELLAKNYPNMFSEKKSNYNLLPHGKNTLRNLGVNMRKRAANYFGSIKMPKTVQENGPGRVRKPKYPVLHVHWKAGEAGIEIRENGLWVKEGVQFKLRETPNLMLKSELEEFWQDPTNIINHGKWLTGIDILKNVTSSIEAELEMVSDALLCSNPSQEYKEEVQGWKEQCNLQFSGSKVYLQTQLLRKLGVTKLGRKKPSGLGNQMSGLIFFEHEEAPLINSPLIGCYVENSLLKFKIYLNSSVLIANMDFCQALSAYVSLCIGANLEYPKTASDLAYFIQINLAGVVNGGEIKSEAVKNANAFINHVYQLGSRYRRMQRI